MSPNPPIQSSQNNIFYLLIFILSLLALAFGLFFSQRNLPSNEPAQVANTCSNEAANYPACDTCTEGKVLIGLKCIDNIQEVEQQKELTDYEKFESYRKISIYSKGLVTPEDYIKNASKYLNDDGTNNVGRRITITGEVEDAYIYVKAGANDRNGNFSSILQEFDSIYFFLKNGVYRGGHLDLTKSKLGESSELTELLYNVKELPVAQSLTQYRKGIFKKENLLDDLKDGRKIGSVVSTSRFGKIENLIIGYKCKGEVNSCEIK